MKKLITALFLWTIVLLPATQIFAQEPESFITQDPSGSSVVETILLADVNVTDVIVSESDGVLTGSFALQGKLGQQTDIVYGVVVVNTEGDIVAVTALGEVSAVQEQEIRTIPFTYTLPSQLRGEVQVLLTAETKQGLPLGTQLLVTKSYPDLPPTMNCEYRGQYSSPACTAAEKGEYTTAYYRESLLSEPELTETIVFEAGVATALFPDVGPGAYTVLLTNSDGVVTRTMFNRSGEYGTILNALVSTETAGAVDLTVTVEAKSETGLELTYTLTDGMGSDCVTNTLPLTGTILKTSVQTTCAEGTLTTTLKTSTGQVLDARTQSFSILPYAAPVIEESSLVNPVLFGGVALIIVMLIIVYIYFRRNKDSHIVASLFIIGLGLFGGTNSAEAATFSIQSWYNGEVSHYVFVTVNSNKSSYAPGENITFSSSADFNHDAYGVGQYLRFTIGYHSVSWPTPSYNTTFTPSTQSSPAFSGVFGNPGNTYNYNYTQPFTRNDSITYPAPSTPGTYYLAFRPLLQSFTCYSNCVEYDNNALIGNVSFTVAAAVPPPSGVCAPVGSLYQWNGVNWDDFGTPSWSPNSLSPSYSMSYQGQILSGPIANVAGTVSGVTAYSLSYPNRATFLRCDGGTPPPSGTCQLGPEQAIESGPTNMFAGTPPCQNVDDLAPYTSPTCPVGATTGTTVNLTQLSAGGFCATRQTQSSQCFGTAYVRSCSGNPVPPPAPEVNLQFR